MCNMCSDWMARCFVQNYSNTGRLHVKYIRHSLDTSITDMKIRFFGSYNQDETTFLQEFTQKFNLAQKLL